MNTQKFIIKVIPVCQGEITQDTLDEYVRVLKTAFEEDGWTKTNLRVGGNCTVQGEFVSSIGIEIAIIFDLDGKLYHGRDEIHTGIGRYVEKLLADRFKKKFLCFKKT